VSSSREVKKVLIVGAGLAGFSAAISLAKLGVEVTIAERSQSLAYGASITIVNRGPDALAELGVLEECAAVGTVGWGKSLYDDFFDSAGNRRPTPPMPIRQDDGLPSYLLIYRPYLARVLSERAAGLGVTLRRGTEVTGLVDHADRVTATLAGGEASDWDLVVAADGTSSKVRRQLFGDRVTSVYSGNMSMRWVKRDPPEGPDGFYVNDESEAVVVHNLAGNMVYIATGINMDNRAVGKKEGVELFRTVLGRFPAPYVKALLATVEDDDEVVVRPYTYHNLPAPWHKGRIMVIGDAAHTMSAHIASGGVMALEDGIVLGQELAVGGELDAALLRVAKRRARRTFVAVDACRQMLDLQVNYQAEPRDLHRVREAAFRELLTAY